MQKGGDDDVHVIFKVHSVDDGKVVIEKIALLMPCVLPSDIEKVVLYKMIELKVRGKSFLTFPPGGFVSGY